MKNEYNILDIIKQNKITDEIKQSVIFYNNEAYKFFDCGLTRYVFVNESKTKVIKILIDNAYDFNVEEFNIYENANENIKAEMALTKLSADGVLIEQEFCNPIKFDEREMTIPEMLFAAQCRNEVGWNSEGKLVCFDLDEYKKW